MWTWNYFNSPLFRKKIMAEINWPTKIWTKVLNKRFCTRNLRSSTENTGNFHQILANFTKMWSSLVKNKNCTKMYEHYASLLLFTSQSWRQSRFMSPSEPKWIETRPKNLKRYNFFWITPKHDLNNTRCLTTAFNFTDDIRRPKCRWLAHWTDWHPQIFQIWRYIGLYRQVNQAVVAMQDMRHFPQNRSRYIVKGGGCGRAFWYEDR